MKSAFQSGLCVLALAGGLLGPHPFAQATAPPESSAPEPVSGSAADRPLDQATLARAAALRDQALAGTGAYAIVEELTTQIGPRMAGTPADARAVDWAVARFKALGYDRVWTEPVTFPVWERGVEVARVIRPYPQSFAIAALGGSVGTPEEGITAQVVAFDSYQDLLEGEREQVQGKIVYIGNRMRRARDGSGYGEAVIARGRGASRAAALGAQALLIRSIGTAAGSRTPHTGMLSYDIAFRRIPGAALSQADADLLEHMLAGGEPVEIQLHLGAGERGDYTGHNVIAQIDGREDSERFVLIGAHLDSWDLGTGALDDGAGLAITMTAGKMIADLPRQQRPRHGLRVVAWAAEEIGLHGARQYAQAHADAVDNHLIGTESDFGSGRIWRFDSNVPDAALPLMAQVHQVLAPLGIERGHNQAFGGPDIGPMRQLGMPVAGLIQDGSRYFDYHHTVNDTLDKVDAGDLDQNVAAYVAFSYLVAEHGLPGHRALATPSQAGEDEAGQPSGSGD
ncbi:MAG: M28 family peptidase [Xanthomonadales bacterium]|nr:M28 family peptidase [Xanthomonadales bacterium]